MSLTGFQRQRRILQGMTPEDGTKPGQISATAYTEGTPDEVQREDGAPEGKELPGNQFVDGGESIAPQSDGVEIPGGQSADKEDQDPDAPEPVKTAENLTDVGGEPKGPDAEAPSATPTIGVAAQEAPAPKPRKRAARKRRSAE